MNRNNLLFVAIISSNLLIVPTLSASDDPSINFREKCRRTISAVFSDAIADLRMAKDSVTLAEKSKKTAQKQLDSHEKKLRALNKKLESKDYAPDLLTERDVLTSQIKLYHEQLTTSDAHMAAAQKQLKDAQDIELRLNRNIREIFHISMVEDPEGGPKPIYNKIEWKSSCPKYRALCPLPEREVSILRTIIKDIEDIDSSCHRYSNLK